MLYHYILLKTVKKIINLLRWIKMPFLYSLENHQIKAYFIAQYVITIMKIKYSIILIR